MAPHLHLKILIVGAGISGLTLACALLASTAGTIDLEVIVLEGSDVLQETGAGLQLSPNATRVLRSFSLDDAFEEVISRPDSIKVRSFGEGKEVDSIPLNSGGLAELTYGSEYWSIARADLQQVLRETAASRGAKIILSKRVRVVDAASMTVACDDGTTYSADLIVGADGITSAVRPLLVSNAGIKLRHTGMCAMRGIVPSHLMESSERTKVLMNDASVWTKPDGTASLVVYPIRKGNSYNVVILQKIKDPSSIGQTEVQAMGKAESIRGLFSSAEQTLRQILSYTDDYTVWSLLEVPTLDRWVNDEAPIVLIGDAAHAMAPHLAQGAAMAIEDSVVLADCLRRIRSRDHIAVALSAYQKLRKLRVEAIAAVSRDLAAARAALTNKRAISLSDTRQQGIGNSLESFSIVDLYSYDGLQETERYFLENSALLRS